MTPLGTVQRSCLDIYNVLAGRIRRLEGCGADPVRLCAHGINATAGLLKITDPQDTSGLLKGVNGWLDSGGPLSARPPFLGSSIQVPQEAWDRIFPVRTGPVTRGILDATPTPRYAQMPEEVKSLALDILNRLPFSHVFLSHKVYLGSEDSQALHSNFDWNLCLSGSQTFGRTQTNFDDLYPRLEKDPRYLKAPQLSPLERGDLDKILLAPSSAPFGEFLGAFSSLRDLLGAGLLVSVIKVFPSNGATQYESQFILRNSHPISLGVSVDLKECALSLAEAQVNSTTGLIGLDDIRRSVQRASRMMIRISKYALDDGRFHDVGAALAHSLAVLVLAQELTIDHFSYPFLRFSSPEEVKPPIEEPQTTQAPDRISDGVAAATGHPANLPRKAILTEGIPNRRLRLAATEFAGPSSPQQHGVLGAKPHVIHQPGSR